MLRSKMTASIARCGGLRGGEETERVLEHLFEQSRKEQLLEEQVIPSDYWPVLPASAAADGEERLLLRGAVLVRVRGQRPAGSALSAEGASEGEAGPSPLSPELVAAVEEPPSRPGRELVSLLRADGLFAPAALGAGLFVAALGVLVEIVLFRGLFDLGRDLGLAEQRLGAIGTLVVFVGALLLLELPIAAATLRLGRHLEVRLRVAFLEKLTRLGDRYFQSRPTSDMAHRSHSVHVLRLLPDL